MQSSTVVKVRSYKYKPSRLLYLVSPSTPNPPLFLLEMLICSFICSLPSLVLFLIARIDQVHNYQQLAVLIRYLAP